MDRKLIAVLTDLDLAEFHLKHEDYDRALIAASVALVNALEGHERAGRDSAEPSPECDAWEAAVQRAFKVKARVLREQSS